MIKNFSDDKKRNGEIYVITENNIKKFTINFTPKGKDYMKKNIKEWKKADLSTDFHSDLIDEENKHVCEIIKPEIIICGGRIDGSLFLFDLKKNKAIGTFQRHNHTIIKLKNFYDDKLLSIDSKGIVNIFEM